MIRRIDWKAVFSAENFRDFALIAVGCLIQAVGLVLFLAPANLISGGISGLAQVINHYSGWPIGVMTFFMNIPVLILGWRYLGKLSFALRTVFAVAMFSLLTDLIYRIFPDPAVTQDVLLNTVFGAVIMGLGFGLVYLGGGTSGGSDIIGRILNVRLGVPITFSFLFTDSLSVILGAVAFGWELGLYGLISIYISGKAAEAISEGSGYCRDVFIITSHPDELGRKIMDETEHGLTYLKGIGAYTGDEKKVLYCVINRSEVNQVKKIVSEVDPHAFMVVGQANEVLGEGFQKVKYVE